MGRGLNRWVIAVVTPPAMVFKVVAVNIYRLLFGRLDVRASRQRESQLALEIQRDLSFLFNEHGAKVIQDASVRYPRPFDYAIVNVALDSLFLRFIRGRGELRVQVAPRRDPHNWSELPVVLGVVDAQERFEPKLPWSLGEVAGVLEPRLSRLRQAFSDEGYPTMDRELTKERDHERAVIRQWEIEINRRLYPDK